MKSRPQPPFHVPVARLEKPRGGILVPRRTVLRGGLATFASLMMSRTLSGCESPAATVDAGIDAPRPFDAGVDAGPIEFPVRTLPTPPALVSRIADIGPLNPADAGGVRLPDGFSIRIIARQGDEVPGTGYTWHQFPDGGCCFITEDSGWILVSNSEFPRIGGVGAIRFASDGTITSAYRVLEGGNINCAGGPTPWHTWLSAEEISNGRVWECDPWGETPSVIRPALGIFKHEAATIDPATGQIYLTEDEPDGRLYRYTPEGLTALGRPDLTRGELAVASVDGGGNVTWTALPDPTFSGTTPTRDQVPTSTPFSGGEGIWFHLGKVYFSTKGDDYIRALDVASQTMATIYDGSDPGLQGVDNVRVTGLGDVLVAEDGGMMRCVAILPDGTLKPIVQIEGQDGSEITGLAFDPSGTRLYFNSQRGPDGYGLSYEMTGPFHVPA